LKPGARVLALELIETVKGILPLEASAPLLEERVIQFELPAREAVQSIENPPIFFRV
jgi:hypothetical protein